MNQWNLFWPYIDYLYIGYLTSMISDAVKVLQWKSWFAQTKGSCCVNCTDNFGKVSAVAIALNSYCFIDHPDVLTAIPFLL